MLLTFDRLGRLRWVLVGIGVLVALYLLLPIVLIVLLSFGSSKWLVFPPPEWTLRWYRELASDPDWLRSFWTSLWIATSVMIVSVVLGTLAAFGLVRGSYPGKKAARVFFLTPMILPVVIFAVAVYAFFLRVHLSGTGIGFVLAHTVLALPFAIISIANSLERFDRSVEDAAVICGASPLEAKWRVTLPAIMPGILAGALFAFLASWDEVVVAIFMASPTLQTLPVRIWGSVRQDLSPVIAAVSTLLVVFSTVLMLIIALLRRGSRPT